MFECIFRRNVKLAIDFCWFHKFRDFSDGIDFITISCNLDLYEDDHKPSFKITIGLFNYLCELDIYNIYHIDV